MLQQTFGLHGGFDTVGTMPMLSVSCSRKVICEVVKALTEASSITAFDLVLEQEIGSTTTFFGTTRTSAELIGTASLGMSDTSAGACPSRIVRSAPRRIAWLADEIAAVVGIGRKQVQTRAVFIFDLVDHAHMGIHQRRQLGQKQPADRGKVALACSML